MDTEQLLRNLGATGNYKGFYYAIYMIEQVNKDPIATTLITKQLYPATAKHFDTSTRAVERNLRTLVRTCWQRSERELWSAVAGSHLSRKPTNSEFLDMTAAYLRRQAQA